MGKGRKKKQGPRGKTGRLQGWKMSETPSDLVLQRRQLFSFVQPPADKRQDGRNGEIDSEVCDAIGQLCAVGLFDGHGHDPRQMVAVGRFWGQHYAKLMRRIGSKTGNYERSGSGGTGQAPFVGAGPYTGADALFDKMDEALGNGFERSALLSLVVDPLIGHRENVPWAQMFIDDELFKRGRFTACMVAGGVTENDRMLLNATIRGLCALVEGSLPGRYERRAAA